MPFRNEQLEHIFNLAFDAAPTDRKAIIARECAGDLELQSQVEQMLEAVKDERFLAAPSLESTIQSFGHPFDAPGSQIGPYRLVKQIGEGGFGVVFLAEQEHPVRRKLALKIIKLGMDTRQVVARFEQERQALALMDHPNIARVFDAGATKSGRPFFVMELCSGESITAFCDTHRLSITQRLELFVQVCNAVQHAHQKGLIHRDIKPSNILVSSQYGKPLAKIIDFGIAKAMEKSLTEQTFITEHHQFIGTLEYMSPEQAQGSPDIDTRADIYSLGVLLYALLTGSTPFDSHTLRSAAYPEVQRIIREVDPPKPSARLTQSTDRIIGVAVNRDVDPARLGTIVRGELDWIVMRALEKDRQRRYQTASALAADVERYLAGEAVLAAPASRLYQLRKLARRNRAAVTGLVAVMLSLCIGAAAFAWQARQARIERDRAAAERDRTLVMSRFLGDMLLGVAPGVARGRDTTMLKEMMDRAAGRIERGDLAGSPESEVQLRGQIGNVYRELMQFADAERMLEPALSLAREALPSNHHLLAETLLNLGMLRRERQDPVSAEALVREAMTIAEQLASGDSELMAELLNTLGLIRREAGDLEQAESLYRDSLEMWERLTSGDHPRVALIKANLGTIFWTRRELDEAERYLRESVEMNQRLFGDYPVTAGTLARLAGISQLRGDLDTALKLARESLEMRRRLYGNDNNREVADSLRQVATVLLAQANYTDAEPMLVQAVKVFRATYAVDSPVLVGAMINLATAQFFNGKFDEAEQTATDALAMQRRLTPVDGQPAATLLMTLANNRRAKNDAIAAERHAREAMEIMIRTARGDSQIHAETIYTLGLVLLEQSRFAEAESLLRESVDMHRRLHSNGHPLLAAGHAELSYAILRQDRAAEAAAMAGDAVGTLIRLVGSSHRHTGTARLRWGQALLAQARLDEAEAELIKAHRVLSSAAGASQMRLLEATQALVALYEARDRAAPGQGHADKANRWRQLIPVTTPTTQPN